MPHHHKDEAPIGILFREQVSLTDEVEGWRRIVDCGYWESNPKGDRIADRRDLVLFQEMVNSAASALQLAIDIYNDQRSYAEMIYHGWTMLERFSWERAITAYQQYLYQN